MAAKKPKKPKYQKSEYPTLTGKPQLGYLNAYYCPVCGNHLFSVYDAGLRRWQQLQKEKMIKKLATV